MKNFIQPGDVITCIAPTGGVVSGGFYLIGSFFGVAATTAAEGAEFEMKLDGVYDGAKTSAQAWTAGAAIYWDATNKVFTTTATSNKLVGAAVLAAANPSGTGRVRLNGVAIA